MAQEPGIACQTDKEAGRVLGTAEVELARKLVDNCSDSDAVTFGAAQRSSAQMLKQACCACFVPICFWWPALKEFAVEP